MTFLGEKNRIRSRIARTFSSVDAQKSTAHDREKNRSAAGLPELFRVCGESGYNNKKHRSANVKQRQIDQDAVAAVNIVAGLGPHGIALHIGRQHRLGRPRGAGGEDNILAMPGLDHIGHPAKAPVGQQCLRRVRGKRRQGRRAIGDDHIAQQARIDIIQARGQIGVADHQLGIR